jgi:hypothetical protein
MMFLPDMREKLERMRATMKQLQSDMNAFEEVLADHLSLPQTRVPPNVLQSIEKELKKSV